MARPLAMFVPQIGIRSETFIRRHVCDLVPAGAVVLTKSSRGFHMADWNVDGPLMALDQIEPSLGWRFIRCGAGKLGWQLSDPSKYIVKRFFRAHKVQVIMGEYLDESLPWLEVAQDLGLRFFVHGHGYDVSRRLCESRWREQYLNYNEAQGVITMSQVNRTKLLEIGLKPSKIHVIPYGVDVPAQPLPKKQHEVVRCLAVGRMVAKKGPILMLDAFRRAAEVFPRLYLDYIGGGALLPAARQFVHSFNLEERVNLQGSQPNEVVQRYLSGADIFVQHSVTDPDTGDEEGLPVGILEAMAQSLPVVSTRHAGIPEAVRDGLTGYLVDEGDTAGMAERLVTLAANLSLRRQMGEAGWQVAKARYSWERERAELLNVLGLEHPQKLSCGSKYLASSAQESKSFR